ncbi:unnamed protein product [Cunninghamella blakesleeana]
MTFHNLVLNSYDEYISSSTLTNQLGKMLNYISYTNGVIYPTQSPQQKTWMTSKDHAYPKSMNKNGLQQPHQKWIPSNHSHLFQLTNRKLSLQSNPDSCCLRKKVLLKHMLKKLQPNKRHAVILLPIQQQPSLHPPKPTYHPKTYFPTTSPLSSSSLLSYQQQQHYHQHYHHKHAFSPKVKLPCPKINTTTMIQRKRHSPPSPISPPIPSKPKCNKDTLDSDDDSDDDDDVPLGTLITQKC